MRRYRLSGRPEPMKRRSARTSGGGGALDHARHQRCRKVQEASQPRTWRKTRGQEASHLRPPGAALLVPSSTSYRYALGEVPPYTPPTALFLPLRPISPIIAMSRVVDSVPSCVGDLTKQPHG